MARKAEYWWINCMHVRRWEGPAKLRGLLAQWKSFGEATFEMEMRDCHSLAAKVWRKRKQQKFREEFWKVHWVCCHYGYRLEWLLWYMVKESQCQQYRAGYDQQTLKWNSAGGRVVRKRDMKCLLTIPFGSGLFMSDPTNIYQCLLISNYFHFSLTTSHLLMPYIASLIIK